MRWLVVVCLALLVMVSRVEARTLSTGLTAGYLSGRGGTVAVFGWNPRHPGEAPRLGLWVAKGEETRLLDTEAFGLSEGTCTGISVSPDGSEVLLAWLQSPGPDRRARFLVTWLQLGGERPKLLGTFAEQFTGRGEDNPWSPDGRSWLGETRSGEFRLHTREAETELARPMSTDGRRLPVIHAWAAGGGTAYFLADGALYRVTGRHCVLALQNASAWSIAGWGNVVYRLVRETRPRIVRTDLVTGKSRTIKVPSELCSFPGCEIRALSDGKLLIASEPRLRVLDWATESFVTVQLPPTCNEVTGDADRLWWMWESSPPDMELAVASQDLRGKPPASAAQGRRLR
jgi:hypothetical protein